MLNDAVISASNYRINKAFILLGSLSASRKTGSLVDKTQTMRSREVDSFLSLP